jgi:hypothetical protein
VCVFALSLPLIYWLFLETGDHLLVFICGMLLFGIAQRFWLIRLLFGYLGRLWQVRK